jgi:hypothetical protein
VTEPRDHRDAGGAAAPSAAAPALSADQVGLERRLRAADPLAGRLPDERSTVLVGRLAADLAAGTPAAARRPQGRRRTTIALLAAALLVCLALASPGIAERFSAWTGTHGSGVGEEDTSEYLLSTAPDYLRAVESLRPAHIPLPPGYEWGKAVELFTELDLSEPTMVPATRIKDLYGHYAACAWEAEWLAGRRTGDTARVQAATRVLTEARSWPDAAADKTGGARRWRDELATAAETGDPGPLRQDLEVNCPPEWIRSGDR